MAFFQEYLDNTLKTPEDVQRFLSLPALGVIPAASFNGHGKMPYGYGYGAQQILPTRTGKKEDGEKLSLILAGSNVNAALWEPYRSLRTSVLLSTSGRPPKIILITSGHPGEGKTTTAVNLGIALVQLGVRVLVVDSDMRRPRIAHLLKVPVAQAGLSTYLTGQSTLEDVVMPTAVPNLFLVPCGPIPPNPAELLSSPQISQFLEEASAKFDYVVLDSPPVLHVSDARILASRAEAVMLVAHGGVTPREAARQAKQHLQQVGANIIGVTLNNVDFNVVWYENYYRYYRRYYSDGYGYGYGYGADSHASKNVVDEVAG
jgi:capsular exopolysaccharide synthesis family protein